LFRIGSFNVTNGLFLTLVVSFILIAFSLLFYKKIQVISGKLQSAIEMAMEWFLELMHDTLGSAKQAELYFPLIATIFVFILCSNLLGIFPGVGSLLIRHGGKTVPLFRSPAADLNF